MSGYRSESVVGWSRYQLAARSAWQERRAVSSGCAGGFDQPEPVQPFRTEPAFRAVGSLVPLRAFAPGGAFESSLWALSGGARIVSGSEPFAATGTLGSWSLSLPAGASAQSPLTCVDAAYPSVRLFIAGTGTVAVAVVYDNLAIPAGVAVAGGAWQPTPVMITASQVLLLGVLSGGTAEVSLRLTALTGSPQLDDVFIVPWNRG